MKYFDENGRLQHSDDIGEIIEHFSFKDVQKQARKAYNNVSKGASSAINNMSKVTGNAIDDAKRAVNGAVKKVRRWGYTNGVPNGKRMAGQIKRGLQNAGILRRNSKKKNQRLIKEAGQAARNANNAYTRSMEILRKQGGTTNHIMKARAGQNANQMNKRLSKAQQQMAKDEKSVQAHMERFGSKIGKAVNDINTNRGKGWSYGEDKGVVNIDKSMNPKNNKTKVVDITKDGKFVHEGYIVKDHNYKHAKSITDLINGKTSNKKKSKRHKKQVVSENY